MNNKPISRRQLLELGAAATVGAVVNTIDHPTFNADAAVKTSTPGTGESVNLSGLAAEYDQHDGLGLAALVAKRQVSPLELLHAVRQRLEVINPRLNAIAQLFFEKAEAQIKQGLPDGPF